MYRELKLPRFHIIKIVLSYAIMAALAIVLSSKIIEMLLARSSVPEPLALFKDGLLILSCLMLLCLMWQRLPRREQTQVQHTAYGKKLGVLFSTLAALIVMLSAASITYRVNEAEDIHEARMQTIADIKTRQISDWLKEREGDVELLKTSSIYAMLYQNWQTDLNSRTRLLKRLEQICEIKGFSASSLLNPEGKTLWSSSPHPLPPALLTTLQEAAQSQKVQRFGPYLDAGGQPSLDFIAPLTAIKGSTPFIILHSNPSSWLFSTLQTQPVPSESSETLLFRQEGRQILFLNKLRHSKDTVLKTAMPLTEEMLITQFLNDKTQWDEMLSGRDYRGEKVLGVIRSVPNTNWFLLSQMDQAELYKEIIKDALSISLAGLLALFMTRAGYVMLRQQEQLVLSANARQLQNERLQALKLLSTIADSSEDAIFAKDKEGRYILFNRAASHFVGQSCEEVLGKDDRDIFPPDQAEMLREIGRKVIQNNIILTQEEILDLPDGQHIFLGTKGPLCDEKGNIIGIFGISRDITERKRAEMVLRENEERFRALVEQSLAGIYIIQRHRLCYVNQGFARIFAHDDAHKLISPGHIEPLVCAHDQERVSKLIHKAESGELSDIHFCFTGVRQDGELIEVEFYGRKVDDKGYPALIGLILDITERKAVEQTLTQQSEELRQRNAELERFNSAMVDRELDMIELKRQLKALGAVPLDHLPGGTS